MLLAVADLQTLTIGVVANADAKESVKKVTDPLVIDIMKDLINMDDKLCCIMDAQAAIGKVETKELQNEIYNCH